MNDVADTFDLRILHFLEKNAITLYAVDTVSDGQSHL